MIDYSVYKLLHVIGFFLLFFSCGVYYLRLQGGGETSSTKLGAWTGGAGLACILVAGFGMMARLGMHGNWPGWLHAKMTMWVIVSVLVFLSARGKIPAKIATPAIFLVAAFAAFLAISKPF